MVADHRRRRASCVLTCSTLLPPPRYQPEVSRTAAEDEDLALDIIDYDRVSEGADELSQETITDRIPKVCAFHADVQAKTVVVGRALFGHQQRGLERGGQSQGQSRAVAASRQSLATKRSSPKKTPNANVHAHAKQDGAAGFGGVVGAGVSYGVSYGSPPRRSMVADRPKSGATLTPNSNAAKFKQFVYSTTPRTPPLRASRGARARGLTAAQEKAVKDSKGGEGLGADFLGGSLTEEDFLNDFKIADGCKENTFIISRGSRAQAEGEGGAQAPEITLGMSKDDVFSNSKENLFLDAANTNNATAQGAVAPAATGGAGAAMAALAASKSVASPPPLPGNLNLNGFAMADDNFVDEEAWRMSQSDDSVAGLLPSPGLAGTGGVGAGSHGDVQGHAGGRLPAVPETDMPPQQPGLDGDYMAHMLRMPHTVESRPGTADASMLTMSFDAPTWESELDTSCEGRISPPISMLMAGGGTGDRMLTDSALDGVETIDLGESTHSLGSKNEMELVYDDVLQKFYHPVTGEYYELKT